MGFLAWIVLGLLAGAIAKVLLPGRDPGGLIVTMVIGILGAVVGGFLWGQIRGVNPVQEFFDLGTWIAAIVGSILLLLIFRVVAGGRHRRA